MMTEEQKKALSNLRKTLVACNRLNYCESAIAELEAALAQPANQSENVRHDALCDTNYSRGVAHGWNLAQNGDSEGMRKCIESRTTAAMSSLAQPESPALKLPDAKPDHDNEEGNDIDYLEPSQVYALGVDDGFNRCLREVVKLNAPHTAPIEPICTTAGAEWMKLPEEKVEIGVNGRFYHNEGWNACLAKVKQLNGVDQ